MTMKFFRSLFSNKEDTRKQLQAYVELEYKQGERDAAYTRLLQEANL
jgi:hypothetical protein